MNKINYMAKILLISIFSILITLMTLYSILIFKPQMILSLNNKISEYKVEYENIKSNNSLLNPKIEIYKIILNKNDISFAEIEELSVGISIFKFLEDDFIFLNHLKIKNFKEKQVNLESNTSYDFKLKINNLQIESESLSLSSNIAYIHSENGKISINDSHGLLNELPYKNLKTFSKNTENKFYYTLLFELNEKIIERQKLFSLENLKDYKINLYLTSKGYFDTKKNILTSFNKYSFKNSKFSTQNDFLLSNINITLYENDKNSLTGFFDSMIPDQNISGSIQIIENDILLQTSLEFNMQKVLNIEKYFALNGIEKFKAKVILSKGILSMDLNSNFSNTKIKSVIKDLNKDKGIDLNTSIKISDMSNPTYLVKNEKFSSYYGINGNGYFSMGPYFNNEINKNNFLDGFYIYLSLDTFDVGEIELSSNGIDSSNIRSLKIQTNKINIFDNIIKDQLIDVRFSGSETTAEFSGKGLNGKIKSDSTGFIRLDIYDSNLKINFESFSSSMNFSNDSIINLRVVGKNTSVNDNFFENINFYLLSNSKITTVDNIFIKSKNFSVSPNINNEKAYFSYDNQLDLYKIRGSYSLSGKRNPLYKILDYDFEYLSTDLNIQWVGGTNLKDIEGNIEFLIKDLQSNTILPDSPFLRAIKLFNLNAFIENISNETNLVSNNLFITRAEGDFYISKKRALINDPIKIESSEAKMMWNGEVLKNPNGYLQDLNLDLSMRLKVTENIPWYAVIFGGMPALAGGLVFENIFEESLDEVSTFKFKVKGSINEPIIERLN